MAKITLRQGETVSNLSELAYHQPEGFQEDNTWYVTEEVIDAESDAKLESGPATIQHGGKSYPVTVTVMEFDDEPEGDFEPDEDEPACQIEIGFAEGLPKLALALGLLDHLTPKQLKALVP